MSDDIAIDDGDNEPVRLINGRRVAAIPSPDPLASYRMELFISIVDFLIFDDPYRFADEDMEAAVYAWRPLLCRHPREVGVIWGAIDFAQIERKRVFLFNPGIRSLKWALALGAPQCADTEPRG